MLSNFRKKNLIEAATIRQEYGKQEISTIAHVRSENNPADALTTMERSVPLIKCILRNKRDLPIRQHVECVMVATRSNEKSPGVQFLKPTWQ